MAFNIGTAFANLVMRSNVGPVVRDAIQSVEALDQSFKKNQYGAIAMSRGFQAMGLAVAGAFAGAIKTAVDWEQALVGVQRTAQATDREMKVLEAGLRSIAATKPIKPIELAGIAEEAGALGVAKQDLIEFTATVADLVATTELTADEASSGLARLTGIMGNSVAEFKNVGGAILELGRSTKATDAEILNMSRRIAGAGKVVGLSTDQVLAYAAAMASVGIREEQGGSGISRTFIDIQNAIHAAGTELDLFARLAGTSGQAFAEAFRADAGQATLEVIEGLGKSGEAAIPILNALGITEIRQRDVLLRLAAATQNYTDQNIQLRNVLQIASRSIEDNTILANLAAQRYATAGSQIAILGNLVHELANSFGAQMLPALKAVTGFLQNMVNALNNMSPAGRQVLTMVVALVGILSAVGIAVMSVSVAMLHMTRVMNAAGGSAARLGNILKGTLATMGYLAAGVGLYMGYLAIWGDKTHDVAAATTEVKRANEDLVASIEAGGDRVQSSIANMSNALAQVPNATNILNRLAVSQEELPALITGNGLSGNFLDQVGDGLVALQREGVPGAEAFTTALLEMRSEWQTAAQQANLNRTANQEYTASVEDSTEALKAYRQAAQDAWEAQDNINQATIDLVQAQFNQRGSLMDLREAQIEYADAVEDANNHARNVRRAYEDLGDAQRDLTRAQEDAIDAQRDLMRVGERAADRLADAEDDLADAQDDRADSLDDIYDAQRRLDKLRSDETVRNLIKATNDLIAAQLGLVQSNRDVADAQFYLNYLRERGASARDIADAELALQLANLGVAQSEESLADAEEGVLDARQAQLDLPRQIAAAERDLEAARRDSESAARDVIEAEGDLAEAREDAASGRAYAEAQRAVEDAQNGVRDAIRGVEDATDSLNQIQREDPANELAQAQLALEQAYYGVAESNVEVLRQQALLRGEHWDTGRTAQALAAELRNLGQAAADSNVQVANSMVEAATILNQAVPQGPRPETDSGAAAAPPVDIPDFSSELDMPMPTGLDAIGQDIARGVSEGMSDGWKEYIPTAMIVLGPLLLRGLTALAPLVLKGLFILIETVVAGLVGLSGGMAVLAGAIVLLLVAALIAILVKTGWAKKIWEAMVSAFKATVGWLKENWKALLVGAIIAALFGIPALIAGLLIAWGPQIIGGLINGIKAAAGAIGSFFTNLFSGGEGGIDWVGIANSMDEAAKAIIEGLVNGLRAGLDALWQFIQDVWDVLVEGFKDLFGISSPSTVFIDIGKDIITGLWNGLKAVWTNVSKWVSEIGGKIIGFFDRSLEWLFNSGKNIITGLWNGVKDVWNQLVTWMDNIQRWVGEKFTTALTWLVEAGKNIIRGLWNGIKALWEGAGSVMEWLGGLKNRVLSIFNGAGNWLYEAGKSILGGLRSGIEFAARSVANAVLTPINWVIDNVINGFMNGIQSLAGKIGIDVDMPTISRLELPERHTGGVAGTAGRKRNLARRPLRRNEELAVLLKGERVLSPAETRWYESNDPNAIRHIGGPFGLPGPDIDIPNPIDSIRDLTGDAMDAVVAGARRVAAEVAKPMVYSALSLMDSTVGKWGPMGDWLGQFMHNVGDTIIKWIEGAENPGEAFENLPNTQGMTNIVKIGRKIQSMGYHVGEHPAFGGVAPVHTTNSYHYRGRAIDVNSYPPGIQETMRLNELHRWIRNNVSGIKELLWRTTGHWGHLHLALAKGGVVNSPTRALIGEAGPEAVIPLDRLFRELERMMQAALEPLLDAQNGLSTADMSRYSAMSLVEPNIRRMADAISTSVRAGDDIDINVTTNADPVAIASEVMWQKRVRLR